MLKPTYSVTSLKTMDRKGVFLSSQVNPNSSSTNLSKLNDVQHPTPNKRINLSNSFTSFQFPITPPVSNSSTPTNEHYPVSSWATKWLPPIDVKVTFLCLNWYLCSIVSSNSTKAILSIYKYPITLTQFQFLINSVLSIALLYAVCLYPNTLKHFPKGVLPKTDKLLFTTMTTFLTPTTLVVSTTLPMGLFQFVGHITSHKATSLIPVSLVHTIKALSPLMTVLIYRSFFKIKYKQITYITLVPLVLGIMLTCYKKKTINSGYSTYIIGLSYAFCSMMIFVSQNIFAKKRLTIRDELPMASVAEKKVDKLTILCYCSMIGFAFTMPVYLLSEWTNTEFSLGRLNAWIGGLVILNGFAHFLQSLLAFQILGAMSPINYSIANILKRIIIILLAFVWENKSFTRVQGVGLGLTMAGLYCYDRWGVIQHD